MRFSKRKLHFLFLSFLCWRNRNRKKTNTMEKAKKPYKNRFLGPLSCKHVKNGFFCKNCLTLFVSGREKKTRIFVHTICFGQNFFWTKTVQTRKNYKNSGFSGNCPKPKKNDTFSLKKVFFDMGEKVGFTNCVFEKLCFCENTIFIVFSAKHSFSKAKTVC